MTENNNYKVTKTLHRWGLEGYDERTYRRTTLQRVIDHCLQVGYNRYKLCRNASGNIELIGDAHEIHDIIEIKKI